MSSLKLLSCCCRNVAILMIALLVGCNSEDAENSANNASNDQGSHIHADGSVHSESNTLEKARRNEKDMPRITKADSGKRSYHVHADGTVHFDSDHSSEQSHRKGPR